MNKKSTFEIRLQETNEHFICKKDETILQGMIRLGKKCIPVGCRSGGCGVCKVHINSGHYQCKKMSRAHISEEEENENYVLSCCCQPLGNLSIKVVGEMKKQS